jgi:hypothetical protein
VLTGRSVDLLTDLPEIIHPQDEWLEFLRKEQIF